MSRPRKSIPSYLPHAQSGRARAVWSDSSGIRHFRMLPGPIDSKESRSAFTALLLELEAAPHSARSATTNGLLLGELLLTYLDHAERHYRGPGGKPTSEIDEVRVVIRALRELYADKSAAEFGPLCLKAARQRWVADDRSRTECNRRVGIVKRIFKWAVSADLVPATTYQALATVSALQKGRTAAPEKAPIGPVDDVTVDTTLPFINRHVCGLVEFQRLTGCRPGEACAVRRCDIDTGGVVWVYRPPHHKNAHRGQARTISVGPKAQEMLREFFTLNLSDYLFSPAGAMDEVRTARAAYATHSVHRPACRYDPDSIKYMAPYARRLK